MKRNHHDVIIFYFFTLVFAFGFRRGALPIEMQRSLSSGLVRMGQISKYLVGDILQLDILN